MKETSVKENRSRDYFVTRDEAKAVLNACPDAEWKLIFALSRYGGLRCPSEHLELRWGGRRTLGTRPNHCPLAEDGPSRRAHE